MGVSETLTMSRLHAPDRHSATLVIEAGRRSKNYWGDLWRYRELMYFLAWRDVTVRYKQTVLGVVWAVLRPALTMLVFVWFRRMASLPTGGVPDALVVFAAVLPWQFFSSGLTESSGSLIGNANLISKVYFPRLIVPAASIVTSLVDFVVTLGLLALLIVWYGIIPTWTVLFLPLFTLLAFGLALGAGLLLAALNVEYRDFRYVVPFIVQFGLFISPVAFRVADLKPRWRPLIALNPMTGVIEGFQWCVLRGNSPLDPGAVSVAVLSCLSFLALGVWYFRRMERNVADVI